MLLWSTWAFMILNHFAIKIAIISQIPHGKKITVALALFVGFLASRAKSQTALGRNLAIFSLFLVLGVFAELSHSDLWRYPQLATQQAKTSESPKHVFLIVLDMFSYEHTIEENKNNRVLQAAKELSQKHSLTLYQNHYTGFPVTIQSIPQIIGNSGQPWDAQGNMLFSKDSIFKKFAGNEHEVRIFARSPSYCRYYAKYSSFCSTEPGKNLGLLEYFTAEFAQSLKIMAVTLHPNLLAIYSKKLSKDDLLRLPESALAQIDEFEKHFTDLPRNQSTFSYLHTLFPHSPFVVDPGCQIIDSLQGKDSSLFFEPEQKKRYQDQALCAISKLDRMIEELKSIGLWQQSTFLVVSDHGRPGAVLDPNRQSSLEVRNSAHVFAWSHSPGQKAGRSIAGLTSNSELSSFLENSIDVLPPQPFVLHTLYEQSQGVVKKSIYKSTEGTHWILQSDDLD